MAAQSSKSAPPTDRIAVVWGPRDAGSEAVEVAAWLARGAVAATVVCVTTIRRPWPNPGKLSKSHRVWLRQEAARADQAVRAEFDAVGLPRKQWLDPPSITVDGTNEATMIGQAVADVSANLVVVGSTASAKKGRFLPGTAAEALLHSSPQPVVLAPRSPKLSKRGVTRITVGLMGEENDHQTLMAAARLAVRWRTHLRIVALSPTQVSGLDFPDDVTHQWQENAFAALDRARVKVADRFPELVEVLSSRIATGEGWPGALDAVKWKKGDLLCFGSAPLGTFERVFVGSQTSEILPHVTVPVLLIPAASPRA